MLELHTLVAKFLTGPEFGNYFSTWINKIIPSTLVRVQTTSDHLILKCVDGTNIKWSSGLVFKKLTNSPPDLAVPCLYLIAELVASPLALETHLTKKLLPTESTFPLPFFFADGVCCCSTKKTFSKLKETEWKVLDAENIVVLVKLTPTRKLKASLVEFVRRSLS